ncbi:MAG: acyl-CoA desaturase, partial [Terracidiphilus sp.]
MASVLSAPSPAATTDVAHEPTATAHAVPARALIRMGRAATVGDGVNWLTLVVIALFHAGALAAFFFFSWQRLAVMAVLHVLAINVGIGMCYHRLLTHRGY